MANYTPDDIEYYQFMVDEYRFWFDGCYFFKKFRDSLLTAMYYKHEHSFRIFAHFGVPSQQKLVMLIQAYTREQIETIINDFWHGMED